MKHRTRIASLAPVLVALFVFFAGTAALDFAAFAQTAPTPPRPVINGPSLDVTLKFIKEKGVLMALRSEPGAVGELARQAFFEVMNPANLVSVLFSVVFAMVFSL